MVLLLRSCRNRMRRERIDMAWMDGWMDLCGVEAIGRK